MDRYFPQPLGNEPAPATAAKDARSVAGRYEISRRFETNILAITTMLGEAKVVADPKDNTIYIDQFLKNANGQPMHFREVGPMLFRNVNGHDKIAFVNDASGRKVIYIDYPFMVFQELQNPLDNKIFNYVVICFSLGVVVLTLLLWPVAAVLRKHYEKPLALSDSARRLRTLAHVECFLVVLFLVLFAVLSGKLETPGGMGAHGDAKLHLMQVIGVLCGIGALVVIYAAVKSWGDATQWRWYKIWNTLLAVACVGFFWTIYHWHLLNFSLRY